MRYLPDAALEHLQAVADLPDLGGTKYELIERMDRGGMGTVYRVRDRELDREVALKVLSIPDGDGTLRQRMLREARILARLEHPGIVPVHDVGALPDGRVFYVMKLVRGRRLDHHLAETTSLHDRLRLFERVCETVAFAHAHGVIHRDLKPENIMVGAFGEVLVLDWGVAKLRGSHHADAERAGAPSPSVATSPHDTASGAVLGTPGYMAPEQARGANDEIDDRTDVYGLGGVLAFVLTGAPPSDGPLPPTAPAALSAACRRARSADPDDRYASAEELRRDVARFLAGERVSAHREHLAERARRIYARHRTPILLVAAYLAMRVALLVFTEG